MRLDKFHVPSSGVASIRRYAAADHQSCLQVFASNVPRYFETGEQADFEAYLNRPDADIWVVELGGAVVACGGHYLRGRVGRLCWGMVTQALHRASIGSALLRWRLDALFDGNAISEVGIDTSQHSAGFFARFGFQVTRTVPDGIAQGIDLVSMSLMRCDWPQPAGLGQRPAAD